MADKGKLRTNGKKGRDRRFLKLGIDSLELRLRNECLKLSQDEENENEDDDDDDDDDY
jgi:hypothetical protein